jgi:adenylate cyclase
MRTPMQENCQPTAGWAARHALLVVAVAPVLAQLVGSAFNIWYNLTEVRPLLTAPQHERLLKTIAVFNGVVYPAITAGWLWVVFRLRVPLRRLLRGDAVEAELLWRARRHAINLPWYMVVLAGAGWLGCIPVLVISLMQSPDALDARVPTYLTISIVVAALIAITHGFFAIELASQRLLFPVLFGDTQPSSTRGAYPLTIRGRGVAWSVSAGVCPIVSLLLLALAPPSRERDVVFPVAVGLLAIVFGLATAGMLGRLFAEPVRELQRAAQRVGEGRLDTRVALLRADEFGPLIAQFNQMVQGLRERKRLQEAFGLHVGQEAARQILARDPGLGGVERRLTIMFVDIRNFTSSCRGRSPQMVVSILNEFLTAMVRVVEQEHGGMVNKYLGDGFMALFGAGEERADHADAALQAGRDMLAELCAVNARLCANGIAALEIGIGIHTGLALVGSIGSEHRLEFTAIGDAVNVASRVESLTKVVGAPLLLTAATRDALGDDGCLAPCAPQRVAGVAEPLATFKLQADV